jgi:hypothetical protein
VGGAGSIIYAGQFRAALVPGGYEIVDDENGRTIAVVLLPMADAAGIRRAAHAEVRQRYVERQREHAAQIGAIP